MNTNDPAAKYEDLGHAVSRPKSDNMGNWIIAIVWYLIGSIGGLWLSRKIYPKTTNGDLVFLFTIGGIVGIVTFLIGLIYLPKGKWWYKQVCCQPFTNS
jgi:FtsH-binding integral membrane protein